MDCVCVCVFYLTELVLVSCCTPVLAKAENTELNITGLQ
jgi:hypothetical protein